MGRTDKPIYADALEAFEQGTVGPAPRRTVSDVRITAVVAARAQMSTLTAAERKIAHERIGAANEARAAAASLR